MESTLILYGVGIFLAVILYFSVLIPGLKKIIEIRMGIKLSDNYAFWRNRTNNQRVIILIARLVLDTAFIITILLFGYILFFSA